MEVFQKSLWNTSNSSISVQALNDATVMMLSANLLVDGIARRKITGMSKPLDLELFLNALNNIYVSYQENGKGKEGDSDHEAYPGRE